MSSYAKGIETKINIIKAAKQLFFEQGYQATTTRQLAKAANVNPGLINYYFESKAAMGLTIYQEIRSAMNGEFTTGKYSRYAAFLIQTASPIMACYNSPQFCAFLNELYDDPAAFHALMTEEINDPSHLYIAKRVPIITPEHARFIQMCLSGTKRNLLHYIASAPSNENSPYYIFDFIRLATELFNFPDPVELSLSCTEVLDSYFLSVGPHMTPIVQKRYSLSQSSVRSLFPASDTESTGADGQPPEAIPGAGDKLAGA